MVTSQAQQGFRGTNLHKAQGALLEGGLGGKGEKEGSKKNSGSHQ